MTAHYSVYSNYLDISLRYSRGKELTCHYILFYFFFCIFLFQQQRRLDLLTIASPDLQASGNEKLKTVLITARVHPGETPSSFVCQGKERLAHSRDWIQILRSIVNLEVILISNGDYMFCEQ